MYHAQKRTKKQRQALFTVAKLTRGVEVCPWMLQICHPVQVCPMSGKICVRSMSFYSGFLRGLLILQGFLQENIISGNSTENYENKNYRNLQRNIQYERFYTSWCGETNTGIPTEYSTQQGSLNCFFQVIIPKNNPIKVETFFFNLNFAVSSFFQVRTEKNSFKFETHKSAQILETHKIFCCASNKLTNCLG